VAVAGVRSYLNPEPPALQAPHTPAPADAAGGVWPTIARLDWTGVTDPNTQPCLPYQISYDVYFGTAADPPLFASTTATQMDLPTAGLDYGMMYYWRVETVLTPPGDRVSSPVWSYTTLPLAAACTDYGPHLRSIGAVSGSDPMYELVVSGNYAYAATSLAGLRIFDVSNPTAPQLVGTYDTPGNALGMALLGQTVCVADGESGVQLVYVADPASPQLALSIDTPGFASDVAVSGTHLLVADDDSPCGCGLRIYDLTNPFAPPVDVNVAAGKLAVQGQYAYVLSFDNGLRVVDISDPEAPQLMGSFDPSGPCVDFVVEADRAWVLDGFNGLYELDITDPSSPSVADVFTLASTYTATSLALSGNRAFVGHGFSGLQVIDLESSDPQPLVGLSTWSVATVGDRLFDGGTALVVADIESPDPVPSFARLGQYSLDVAVAGAYAYVADGDLRTVDVADPTAPVVLGTLTTPGSSYAVAMAGDHLMVADGSAGLRVIDVSVPSAPSYAGSVDTPGVANDVAVDGTLAAISDWTAGLTLADISQPALPQLRANLALAQPSMGVALSGGLAYVAVGTAGLQIVEVSDPTAPEIVGSVDTPGFAWDLAVAGGIACVADGTAGLQVIDVSDPAQPQLLGGADTPGNALGVTMSEGLAYVADSFSGGVRVFDLTDPSSPSLRGVGHGPSASQRLTVAQHLVYVASGNGGLDILPTHCGAPVDVPPGDPIVTTQPPRPAHLLSPYPNPANPSVVIPVVLEREERVRLTIHDVAGREVVRLFEGRLRPGAMPLGWNGLDAAARPVAAGVYLVRLVTTDGAETRKVALVK
jgi:hypothetical protein